MIADNTTAFRYRRYIHGIGGVAAAAVFGVIHGDDLTLCIVGETLDYAAPLHANKHGTVVIIVRRFGGDSIHGSYLLRTQTVLIVAIGICESLRADRPCVRA